MLKQILNLTGAQELSKKEQQSISGGLREGGLCTTISITEEIYGPYNGCNYSSHTITYQCEGGPVQTGPWGYVDNLC